MPATRSAPSISLPSADQFGPMTAAPRRPRNVPGAVLGALLVVVCAFAVGAYATTSGHKTQVILVTQTVPAGSTIKAGDLAQVGVAADNRVSAIPASDAAQVVGKPAAETLEPGSLLTRGELGTIGSVPAADSIVGLALKAGAFPASLGAGDTVTVMSTPTQTAVSSGSASAVIVASKVTVYSVGESSDGQSTLVSVIVPNNAALAIATAQAEGTISVALVSAGR